MSELEHIKETRALAEKCALHANRSVSDIGALMKNRRTPGDLAEWFELACGAKMSATSAAEFIAQAELRAAAVQAEGDKYISHSEDVATRKAVWLKQELHLIALLATVTASCATDWAQKADWARREALLVAAKEGPVQ